MCRYSGMFQIFEASLDCKFTMEPTPMLDFTPLVMRRLLA
jgi:hypothetical protein